MYNKIYAGDYAPAEPSLTAEWYDKLAQLRIKFRADLFNTFDVVNNTKAEKLYNLLSEKYPYFENMLEQFSKFVDLIKE